MSAFSDFLRQTGDQFVNWAEQAVPQLLLAAVILIVGLLLAKLVKVGAIKFLRLVKLDVVAEKAGIDRFLERGNIKSNSVDVVGILVLAVDGALRVGPRVQQVDPIGKSLTHPQ